MCTNLAVTIPPLLIHNRRRVEHIEPCVEEEIAKEDHSPVNLDGKLPRLHQAHRPCGVQDGGGPLLELLSMPTASRRAFSFAAFSLVASMRRSAAPESQFVDDAAIARRDSDSLTLTGIPACGLTSNLSTIRSSESSIVEVERKCRSLVEPSLSKFGKK